MHRTLPAHRPPPTAEPTRRRATLRLGLVLSLVAAVLAVVVEAVADVPAMLVVAPVVVIGFALSWHASAPPHG